MNVDNFARAETDIQIARVLKMGGTVNEWTHNRQPTPLDKQNVIRMNHTIAVPERRCESPRCIC